MQWRPKDYWPAGTKVKVTAAVGGVEFSPGVWGRRTVTSAFSIGARQISTVDIAKHTLTVTRNGKVIKVIPVTTGMTNSKPTFPTRGGIKVIMSREASVRMDAATTGTDPKDPNYYNLTVHWALRLTYSGEFLHAAPWSVASQGKANVSHGCTGMSDAEREVDVRPLPRRVTSSNMCTASARSSGATGTPPGTSPSPTGPRAPDPRLPLARSAYSLASL